MVLIKENNMNKGTTIKIASVAIGAIIAITLISAHPIPITLLGFCAAIYFVGEGIEKGKFNL